MPDNSQQSDAKSSKTDGNLAPCPFCNRPNAVKLQQQELYTHGGPSNVAILTPAGFAALDQYHEMTDRIEELIAENDRLKRSAHETTCEIGHGCERCDYPDCTCYTRSEKPAEQPAAYKVTDTEGMTGLYLTEADAKRAVFNIETYRHHKATMRPLYQSPVETAATQEPAGITSERCDWTGEGGSPCIYLRGHTAPHCSESRAAWVAAQCPEKASAPRLEPIHMVAGDPSSPVIGHREVK